MQQLKLTIKGPVALTGCYSADTGESWNEPSRFSLREHFGYASMFPRDREVYLKAEAAMCRVWKRETYRKVR